MNKISLLVISSVFLLTGCTLFGGGEDDVSITPIPPQNPTPTPEETPTPETTDNNQGVITTGGLIPATTPQDRLRQIEQGRNNPFNSISPPAVIRVREDQPIPVTKGDSAILRTPVPTVGESMTPGTGTLAFSPTAQGRTNGNVTTGDGKNGNVIIGDGKNGFPVGAVVDLEKIKEQAPVLSPSPTEANGILVSGIIDVNGQTVALVKAPWDSTTQSVRVGDVISDGNVRIRIRDIRFSYPTNIALRENDQTVYRNINDNGVVILEQYGQQVTKKVGMTATEEDKVAQL